jgi:hypothetical protein
MATWTSQELDLAGQAGELPHAREVTVRLAKTEQHDVSH